MIVSRYTLKNIDPDSVTVPDESLFELPEKVLQFGSGVLLRGLPDYFIDKANRQGVFNGRIVAVKSTSQGDVSAFDKQDGLYTLCIRDQKNGENFEENIINSSISRVLNAATQWNEVLDCAHSRDIKIIVSNTTEVGIQLILEDIRQHPPKSYPAKLLAFLYERFNAFGGSAHSGMVIIPTELVSNNGKKLEAIVLELAHLNGLEEEFLEWLENHNHFCNSLVDRIVAGKPNDEFLSAIEDKIGYHDNLLITAEDFGLWAIEGDGQVKEVLSFAQADSRVIIKEDIDLHRELKLRLLNGTHTLSCGIAFLAGCKTVSDAMNDKIISSYIVDVVQNEIASAIPYDVDSATIHDFASKVLDRFRNSQLRHRWLSIALNYSTKLKLRCIPVLMKHYERNDTVPEAIALGFASYIYFMKAVACKGDEYYGEFNGESYLIQDDLAEIFYKRWTGLSIASLVQVVISDAFWGVDLLSLPGFKQSVIDKLNLIINNGMKEAVESIPSKKIQAA
ncbi:MAG TPA: tagaturonate reductase [Flavisolibacter sp.]|nr:tagaturonate reductase [Flavisolibacter sp.]